MEKIIELMGNFSFWFEFILFAAALGVLVWLLANRKKTHAPAGSDSDDDLDWNQALNATAAPPVYPAPIQTPRQSVFSAEQKVAPELPRVPPIPPLSVAGVASAAPSVATLQASSGSLEIKPSSGEVEKLSHQLEELQKILLRIDQKLDAFSSQKEAIVSELHRVEENLTAAESLPDKNAEDMRRKLNEIYQVLATLSSPKNGARE